MLISSFLSCVLLLVQGAICSDLHQDTPRVNKELSKDTITDTDLSKYAYHHPPEPEVNVEVNQERSRKEKSLDINEQTTERPRSRGIRRRGRPTASTPNLEIPVQVIYDTPPTTVSPLDRTTRIFVRRRKLQPNPNKKINIRQTTAATSTIGLPSSTENVPIFTEKVKSFVSTAAPLKRSRGSQPNANKKIDIRETTPATSNVTITNVSGNTLTLTEIDKSDVSVTEFPKRSRDSYFKKRTEGPAPKVKILEEKNFVFSHSGNFHYSFLGGDGTKISSEGSLKSYDNNKTGESVSGNVFYKDNDGNNYSLSYTADENGYRPIGAHLPTPPPLPPAIARALKYIADKSTPSPIVKDE